jgi:hypothetical protein
MKSVVAGTAAARLVEGAVVWWLSLVCWWQEQQQHDLWKVLWCGGCHWCAGGRNSSSTTCGRWCGVVVVIGVLVVDGWGLRWQLVDGKRGWWGVHEEKCKCE